MHGELKGPGGLFGPGVTAVYVDTELALAPDWLAGPIFLGLPLPTVWKLKTSLGWLQGKGRRESEGSKGCRRPNGQSPASTEKRLSAESFSSLPEVSSSQPEGASTCSLAHSPGLQLGIVLWDLWAKGVLIPGEVCAPGRMIWGADWPL